MNEMGIGLRLLVDSSVEVTMRTAILAMLLAAGCAESVTIPEGDASVAPDADCACVVGPCCDGECGFLGPDVACVEGGMIAPTCETERRIASPIGDRYCSGASSACDGEAVPSGAASVAADCGTGVYGTERGANFCVESAAGASCASAP